MVANGRSCDHFYISYFDVTLTCTKGQVSSNLLLCFYFRDDGQAGAIPVPGGRGQRQSLPRRDHHPQTQPNWTPGGKTHHQINFFYLFN